MEIKSKFLGTQQIDPDSIINFPIGIPGFENQKRFKLFHQENNPVIYWLQSLDDENLTFSVATPSLFNINYNFLLTDEELELLELTDSEDLIVLILLHKDNDGQETQNPVIKGSIKSPLLINSARQKGMQKCLAHIEQSIILTEKSNEIDLHETRG